MIMYLIMHMVGQMYMYGDINTVKMYGYATDISL